MPEFTASIQEVIRVHGLWLIPFLPAVGAFINLIFGALIQKRLGKTPIHAIAVGSMALSSVVAIFFFIKLLLIRDPAQRFMLDFVWPMLDIGAVQVDLAFAMDPLSGLMATMVTVVATAIHVYSVGYMHDEPSYWRFFGYLNLFCFSMLMLVLGDNMIVMFFGWEGVGLCSYLLIGFWYKDIKKAKAGMKAFVVNRIGDFGFIIGMSALFWGLLGMWDAPLETGSTLKHSAHMTNVDDGRCVQVTARKLEADDHGHKHATPKSRKTHRQLGRCGATLKGNRDRQQNPVAVGAKQLLYLGPTVSFREIKDQLSLQHHRPGSGVLKQRLKQDSYSKDHQVSAQARRQLQEINQRESVTASHLAASKLEFKLFGWLAKPLEKMGLKKWAGWLGGGWIGIPLLILVTFGLFLGACGKSAQIPLYTWLPDAMAGPTPVSALIHAATMVTAGVYMVARLNFVFVLSPEGMTLVAVVGAMTALFAASIGLFQYDIKKVLAYSTVSQLGFMFVAVGVGAYWVGVYHLLTHAFFKACLFLGSGSVIHGMHDYCHHTAGHPHPEKYNLRLEPDPADPQDMRNMGGLARLMPKTHWTYFVACLAISGIPFFSGFYSKDEILWKAFSTGNIFISGRVIWAMCAVAAVFTAFYMFRSYYMTFHGRAPSAEHKAHVHESPLSMTGVLIFLAAGAVLMSLAGSLAFIPAAFTGHPWIANFLAPVMAISDTWQRDPRVTSHAVEYGLMALSVVLALVGILGARYWYKNIAVRKARMTILIEDWGWLHKLIHNKYFVDEIYDATVVRGFMVLTRVLAWIDLYIVDGLVNGAGYVLRAVAAAGGYIDYLIVDGAVNGVATFFLGLGRRVPKIQTGRINTYVMGVTFGVVVLLFIVWFISPTSGH